MRARQAFTVVEMVIATAVIVVALSVLLHSYLSAATAALVADKQMEYMHRARRHMEGLLTNSYISPAMAYGTRSIPGGGGFYRVSTNARFPASVKDITVTTVWTNAIFSPLASTVTLHGAMSWELHP